MKAAADSFSKLVHSDMRAAEVGRFSPFSCVVLPFGGLEVEQRAER